MFRQLALQQSRTVRASVKANNLRLFSSTSANLSVVQAAKDALLKANKKTGEILAGGMDAAEKATPTGENIADTASKINKKTGEVLADGMEKVQQATPDVDSVGDAASKLNKKTGEVLADGMSKVEHVQHKQRVNENTKGYESLQDKGSKAESEQNRPDDAV